MSILLLLAPGVAATDAKVSWVQLEIPYTAVTGSTVKYWTGAAWTAKPLKRWNGAAWVPAALKRYNGASWVAA
jgi:hypothetical protein